MKTPRWKKVTGWIFTPFFVVSFFAILVVFHVGQLLVHPFSRRLQWYVLELMNFSIVTNIRLLAGAKVLLGRPASLPADRPVIIVSNHQSMYDIPMIMWATRWRSSGFIAKKELGRGIPSISFALRHLDSVLIDRKDARGAVSTIEDWGRRMEAQNGIAAIFPEGTRARDGQMKKFKTTGLAALLRTMPTAVVQPVMLDGNWELLRYRFAPVPFGIPITLKFLDTIEPDADDIDGTIAVIEQRIRDAQAQLRNHGAALEL